MSKYKKNKHFTKPSGEPMYQTHFSEDEIPIEVKNWFNENTTENNVVEIPSFGLRVLIRNKNKAN